MRWCPNQVLDHLRHRQSRASSSNARHHKNPQHHKARRSREQPPECRRPNLVSQSAHTYRSRPTHTGSNDRKSDLMRFRLAIVQKIAGRRLPFSIVEVSQGNK